MKILFSKILKFVGDKECYWINNVEMYYIKHCLCSLYNKNNYKKAKYFKFEYMNICFSTVSKCFTFDYLYNNKSNIR